MKIMSKYDDIFILFSVLNCKEIEKNNSGKNKENQSKIEEKLLIELFLK